MFFLNGFSSMFPYVLYLALMWLCILVGIRGKLLTNEISNAGYEKSLKIIDQVNNIPQKNTVLCVHHNQGEKYSQKSKQILNIFIKRFLYSSFKVFFPSFQSHFQSNGFHNPILLRGPPTAIA